MSNRDPQFDAYVLKIYEVLDQLDYYRLLGVDSKAGVSAIRKAFYAIAAKFHPDRNRDADPRIKKALYNIFKRLNEAYRILCDAQKRVLYDKGLQAGKVRLEQDSRRKNAPQNPEDTIKSRDARQFYRQAATELKKGSLMNAELHIKVAASREPRSEAIKDLAKQIMEAKQKK
ncbi:MAG: DnaJ domain-containing protein [Deltaproteobacteria bacterium]|nr:DnaJ domain-containing protein [Deltaproteobacteria bacterium]